MDHLWHMDFDGFQDRDLDRSHLKDSAGRYRCNIFAEFNKTRHDDYPPIYTMREEPMYGLPSAYLIYMYSDSEYEAAMKLVGSWQHWQKLLKSKPFMKGLDDHGQWVGLESWREEKEVKDMAVAYNQLQINAAQGNVQAQKMIYEGKKTASKRGRPSKEEIQRVAREHATRTSDIKSDLKRLKLVVNGDSGNS